MLLFAQAGYDTGTLRRVASATSSLNPRATLAQVGDEERRLRTHALYGARREVHAVIKKASLRMGLLALVALVLCEAGGGPLVHGATAARRFGTITGSVRDHRGNPLAGALVTVLRDGAEEIVKQTRSTADGSFTARIVPGRYILRAVAEGFNSATFSAVQINPAAELVYRFNLEPAGQGRTVAERRPDRRDPKFAMRANQIRRSIFNHGEEDDPGFSPSLAEDIAAAEALLSTNDADSSFDLERSAKRRGRVHGVVETYFASGGGAPGNSFAGVNFAVANPVNERLDLVFAGQFGAFERLETTARIRAGARHRVSATVGGMRLSTGLRSDEASGGNLGQFSVRAVDEWLVRDGVVVVLGLDYSRFVGAASAGAFSPRIGFQYDAGARTRLKAAYAPGGDESDVQSTALFEDGAVIFRQATERPVALVDGRAVLERSHRLEFGLERVLDDASTIEATAFFDATDGRGVGLLSVPGAAFAGTQGGAELLSIANQQGAARGMRVVYTRRLGHTLKASAGYAFGRGQQLAPGVLTSPDRVFSDGFFQTVAAQVDADVLDGTRVRTVLRFSPRAAVFAIDPFAGQLAVYDPSLSILVTHELPNFGLPLRAEAMLDARNLFDVMSTVEDGENLTSINAARRMVRGGISVRF